MNSRRPPAEARRIVAKARLHSRPVRWLGVAMIVAGLAVAALPEIGSLVVGAIAGWLLWLVGAAMLLVSILVATGKSLWPESRPAWRPSPAAPSCSSPPTRAFWRPRC